ncbi:hypothetical protein UYSO10_3842 [Kosakonia radicincitans]|nr:hypothetical protein UYSO10_3842 [Kosakonia radicincitans]
MANDKLTQKGRKPWCRSNFFAPEKGGDDNALMPQYFFLRDRDK